MSILSNDLVQKIMLMVPKDRCTGSPTAAIVKQSWRFVYHKCYNEYHSHTNEKVNHKGHGAPFDRGRADAYYNRRHCRPHKWILDESGEVKHQIVQKEDLTEDEIREYLIGYDTCEECR